MLRAPSIRRTLANGWEAKNSTPGAPSIRRTLANGWEAKNPALLHALITYRKRISSLYHEIKLHPHALL
jgi:hypothetical protein